MPAVQGNREQSGREAAASRSDGEGVAGGRQARILPRIFSVVRRASTCGARRFHLLDTIECGDRADRSHGAGLGLPIGRAIMRAMDGDPAVEFALGGTSFFRLRMPRVDT